MTTESTEEVCDNDKDTLMEVRGIIDGVLDSGSNDYSEALKQIAGLITLPSTESF